MGPAYYGMAIVVIFNLMVSLALSLPFMAQVMYYLYLSFDHDLPWAECDYNWALENCVPVKDLAIGSEYLDVKTGMYSTEQFYLR